MTLVNDPLTQQPERRPTPRPSSMSTRSLPRTTTSVPTRPTRHSGSPSARPATAARRSVPRSTRRTSSPRPRRSGGIANRRGYHGPLFIGRDTHALSEPATRTALEVLAAHGADLRVDARDGFTPTPAVSHAILVANSSHETSRGPAGDAAPAHKSQPGLADGIVVTPSHNPPDDGGFKYNPPNGGPADTDVTRWIQDEANRILEGTGADGLDGIPRVPWERARGAAAPYDFLATYVEDLGSVIDMAAIAQSGLRIGVDPMGGASVAYWGEIGDRYGLDLTVTNEAVDPTFGFMTVDWDGKIRMDPSSPYAMARLVGLRDRFDIALGNDTDADRHGVVTPGAGLLNPNHFLSAAISYLFGGARAWGGDVGVGKTLVSSSMIDRVVSRPRSAARRGPGRLQVVRRWARRRLDRVRWRGERRARRSCGATARSGRPTRTASSPACWRAR